MISATSATLLAALVASLTTVVLQLLGRWWTRRNRDRVAVQQLLAAATAMRAAFMADVSVPQPTHETTALLRQSEGNFFASRALVKRKAIVTAANNWEDALVGYTTGEPGFDYKIEKERFLALCDEAGHQVKQLR